MNSANVDVVTTPRVPNGTATLTPGMTVNVKSDSSVVLLKTLVSMPSSSSASEGVR
jgi:hypothetical protein